MTGSDEGHVSPLDVPQQFEQAGSYQVRDKLQHLVERDLRRTTHSMPEPTGWTAHSTPLMPGELRTPALSHHCGKPDPADSVVARFTFTEGEDGRFAVTRAEAIRPVSISAARR